MKKFLILILMPFALNSLGQSKHMIIINKNAIPKLTKFKKETKFDATADYTGLSDSKLNPKFSELLNKSADDFMTTINNKPSEKKFQQDIKNGLARFNPYYLDLDTEDREKVCSYYVELMQCVNLKSSDGEINKWLYGFDTSKK